MKKTIAVIMTMSMLFSSTTVYASSGTNKDISVITNQLDVIVNGQRIASDNLLYNSTTYLPIRAISESVGMSVDYNDEQQTVDLKSKGNQKITTKQNRGIGKKSTIKALFNSLNIFVNGNQINGENIVYNATTYLPLRLVSEATGTKVDYDAENKAVYLTTPDYVEKADDITKANNLEKPSMEAEQEAKADAKAKQQASTSTSKSNSTSTAKPSTNTNSNKSSSNSNTSKGGAFDLGVSEADFFKVGTDGGGEVRGSSELAGSLQ